MKSTLTETPAFWRKRAPRIGIEIGQPGFQTAHEPDWVEKALGGTIPYGERDDTIFRLGGHLKSKGIPEGEAIEILSLVAENRCEQPEGDKFTREDVVKKVRSSYKGEGEEAGRLNSLTGSAWLEREIEELPELVNYWVRVGDLTLLVGASGVGKSSIALPLALSLAGGVPFLGFEVPSPERVLYLDLEMGEFEFSTRLQTLLPQFPDIATQNFYGISIPSKERTSFKINRESDKLQLLNELKIVRPKLLVIDNHTRFHSGDPNIEKDMSSMILTPFSEMMAEFDLGILYVMHTGWRERERPRGSAAILDAATTEIVVAKKNALRERTLKWEKNRPVRRQQGITKLNVTYDFDTFMVETGELDGISALIQQVVFPIERTELAQRIMEDLNVGKTWAYRQIKRLEERGDVVADGKLLRLPFDDIGDL